MQQHYALAMRAINSYLDTSTVISLKITTNQPQNPSVLSIVAFHKNNSLIEWKTKEKRAITLSNKMESKKIICQN